MNRFPPTNDDKPEYQRIYDEAWLAEHTDLDGTVHFADGSTFTPAKDDRPEWAHGPKLVANPEWIDGTTELAVDPKPMRLRYMELPTEINSDTGTPVVPFVMVLDRTGDKFSEMDERYFAAVAEKCGARNGIIFEGEVQIGEDYAEPTE